MKGNSESTPNFFRDRILNFLDNLAFTGIMYALSIVLPVVLGIVLKLEIQVILLMLLLGGQVIAILLLFSVQRKLTRKVQRKDQLIRNADTDAVYFIDRFGLPHPIGDERTVLYFMHVLGYRPDELAEAPSSALRPSGAEVTAIREWRMPRTVEDDMSHEARSLLKLSPKHIRTENGSKVLSFDVRNDSDHCIQIDSARLVFDADAPLAITDISPKNKPTAVAMMSCVLLFNGESESKRLVSQEESRLDLALNRSLTAAEASAITSARFGYIEIKGIYRDTQVTFHVYV
jgi:hypothetical protein